MSELLEGKNALVVGVANERSIAWGIAKKLREHAAKVVITCQSALHRRVAELGESIGARTIACDFTGEGEVVIDMGMLPEGGLDTVVHSVAFADRDALKRGISEATHEQWQEALTISAYSLLALTKKLRHTFKTGSSIITLTFTPGSQSVLEGYGLMGVAKIALEAQVRLLACELGEDGIRVNAISAGPIKTISAIAVPRFNTYRKAAEREAPLRRLRDGAPSGAVSGEDIGDAAVFLASNLAGATTGHILPVDCGAGILGAIPVPLADPQPRN